ncbi:PQQ-binding-like beta-propeller repeat protein [Planctomycetota bacterium]
MSLRKPLFRHVLTIAFTWTLYSYCAGGDKPSPANQLNDPIQLSKSWYVMAPFPLGEDPIGTAYPPERKVDLKAKYKGTKTQVAWQARPEGRDGIIWLHQAFGEDFVAYAYAEFDWDNEEKGYLFIGSDDGIVLWLNGTKILEKNVARAVTPGEEKVLVTFIKGKNRILLKLIQGKGDAGFIVRGVPADLALLSPKLRAEIIFDTARSHSEEGDPQKALVLVEALMGEVVLSGSQRDFFVNLCLDYGSLARAARAFAAQAELHSSRDKVLLLSYAANLYIQAEDTRAATGIVDSIEKETKKPQGGLRRNIGLAEHRASVLLPESMGVTDTLAFIRNTLASGSHQEAAAAFQGQLEELRDTVVLFDDKTGCSTTTHMREVSREWAGEFHRELARLAEKETKKRLASAARIPAREAAVWELFRESDSAKALGASRATELLDSGNAARAALWYLELSKRSESVQARANCAFSLAAAGYGECLKHFTAALTEEQKKEAVTIGGKKTTLLQAVTGFEKDAMGWNAAARSLPDKLGTGWSRYLSLGQAARGLAGIGGDGRGPIVPATLIPGVDGTRLVVNTGARIRCYDLKNGDILWTCRPYDATSTNYDYKNPSVPVPILGAETYGGRAFVRSAPSRSKEGIVQQTDLNAIDTSTGEITWRLREVPGMAGPAIVSEPLVAYGALFLVVARRGAAAITLSAVSLSPATGEMLWKRTLVSGADRFAGEYITAELPRPLLTPRGVVFATHMGVIGRLNPLTGAIERMTAYERRGMGRRSASRYHVNPLFYSNGVIVTAPRDSDQVFSIDETSGKITWSADRSRTPFLAGVMDGGAFVAGAGVLEKLDSITGEAISRVSTDVPGELPISFMSETRLWISTRKGLHVFDTKTLERIDPPAGMNASSEVVPTDDHIVSLSNDSTLVVLPKDEKVSLSAAREIPVKINLGKQPLGPCPGGARPVLWWITPDVLANLCLPDSVHGLYPPGDHRGAFVSWNEHEVKLHDLNGFGQVIWERAVAGAGNVVWFGDGIVVVTAEHVMGLDVFTGKEVWKHACGNPGPYLTYLEGRYYFQGKGNRSIVCVDAVSGAVQWTTDIPRDVTGSQVVPSAGNLYLFGRNTVSPGPWDVRSIDVKTGDIKKRYSRALKHNNERFVGIFGDTIVWTLGALGWGESMTKGTEIWQVKGPRWSAVAHPVYDGQKRRRLLFLRVDRGDDIVLDPETGARVIHRQNGHGPWTFHKRPEDSYLWVFGKHIGSKILRVKTDGNVGTTLWEYKADPWDWSWMHAMSAEGDSVRAAWKQEGWFRLADIDKNSGKLLGPQVVMSISNMEQIRWLYGGNILLVKNREGLRCFRMMDPGTDVSKSTAKRMASARKLPHAQEKARAIATVRIGASMLETLDMSWLAAKKPLSLDSEHFWLPIREKGVGYRSGEWGGPDDLSARVTMSAERGGTRIVIEITDDHWEPFDGTRGGDHVRIRFGHIDTIFGAGPDGTVRWNMIRNHEYFRKDCATVSLTEKGRVYNLLVNSRIMSLQYHNVDTIVVTDDDGDGPKGGMEWGTRVYRSSR